MDGGAEDGATPRVVSPPPHPTSPLVLELSNVSWTAPRSQTLSSGPLSPQQDGEDTPGWWRDGWREGQQLNLSGLRSNAHGRTTHAESRYGNFNRSLSRLPLWYQIAALAAACAVLWNSDELAAKFPAWQAFCEAFVEPPLELVESAAFFGLSENGDTNGRVHAKHRVVLLVQAAALGALFVILRRVSDQGPFLARARDAMLFVFSPSARQSSGTPPATLVVAGRVTEVAEVLFAVHVVGAEPLDSTRMQFLAVCTSWARALAVWWLAGCLLPSLAALLHAAAAGCRHVNQSDAAFTSRVLWWRTLAAVALRAAAAGSTELASDFFGNAYGDLAVGCVAARAVVAHAAANLSEDTCAMSPQLLSPDSSPADSPAGSPTATTPAPGRCPALRAAWGHACSPLENVLGVLLVARVVTVLPLLVVVVLLFLALVSVPAAIDAFSTDFFFHTGAVAALGWHLRDRAEDRSWRRTLLFFCGCVGLLVFMAYWWRAGRRAPRTAGAVLCLAAALMPRDLGATADVASAVAAALAQVGRAASLAWSAAGWGNTRFGRSASAVFGGAMQMTATLHAGPPPRDAVLGVLVLAAVLLFVAFLGGVLSCMKAAPPSPRRVASTALPGVSELARMCSHSAGSLLLSLAAWAPAHGVRVLMAPIAGGGLVAALVFLTAFGYVVPWRGELLLLIDRAVHNMP